MTVLANPRRIAREAMAAAWAPAAACRLFTLG